MRKHMIRFGLCALLAAAGFIGEINKSHAQEMTTVPYVEVSRYAGTWYQIARNPIFFENGCVCSRQVLAGINETQVSVYNTCNDKTVEGPLREIRGVATNLDPATNAKFSVDFNLPKKGAYWVIGLDPEYRYAVVSEPSRASLYILSKTPTLSDELYHEALAQAAKQTNVSHLQRTVQEGCSYPTLNGISESLPAQPQDPENPGSAVYKYSLFTDTVTIKGRTVEFFAPAEMKDQSQKAPVIVFGHGQALGSENYRETLQHLAKKGVAVIFPQFDTGFFDQDWNRMAADYSSLAAAALQKYEAYVDAKKIVFAGHSKGAYIALMAAGLAKNQMAVTPSAVVVFAPAGYSADHLKRVPTTTPVTIVYSDADSVIKPSLINEIYSKLTISRKQLITMSSYRGTSPELEADHFLPVSKGEFYGGNDGVTAFHFFGVWKFLMNAAWDLKGESLAEAPGLYGDGALDTGLARIKNKVQRNW